MRSTKSKQIQKQIKKLLKTLDEYEPPKVRNYCKESWIKHNKKEKK